MMHTLSRKTKNKKRRIVGRGGRHAKTSGRGTKGQKARAGHRIRPEIRDMIKKLPKMRGRGKNVNKPVNIKPLGVSLSKLNVFEKGTAITPAVLIEKKVISLSSGKIPRVKILANGTLEKALVVSGFLMSKKAKDAIEKAGGSVN